MQLTVVDIWRNPPQSADVWVLYWLTVITIPNSSLIVIWCIAVHDNRHRFNLSLAVKIKLKKIRYGDRIQRYCTCTHKYHGTVPVRLNTAVHRYTGNTTQPYLVGLKTHPITIVPRSGTHDLPPPLLHSFIMAKVSHMEGQYTLHHTHRSTCTHIYIQYIKLYVCVNN